MSITSVLNSVFTFCTYGITLFFLIAFIRAFIKSKNIQDSIIYAVIMVPFVLRILRLK